MGFRALQKAGTALQLEVTDTILMLLLYYQCYSVQWIPAPASASELAKVPISPSTATLDRDGAAQPLFPQAIALFEK
jgi:hypothetical protein